MVQSPPARRGAGITVTILASLALLVTGASLPAAAHAPLADDVAGPAPDRSPAEWRAWADDLRTELEATDWAALSEASGCELTSVEIVDVVDGQANAEAGAPADLALPVVHREEDCAAALAEGIDAPAAAPPSFTALGAQVAASSCRGVTGGRSCIARSGSYVTGSYTYYGSGTTSGFSRLYRVSSLSGCPRGTTMATSSDSTLGYGGRSSVTAALGAGKYSMHFWRKVLIGHSDTGGACAAL